MWGDADVKNTNFGLYWFEQAVAQNDRPATIALANLLLAPPLKDLLRARSLAARLLSADFEAAKEIFSRINKQIQDLNIGGSRDLHKLSGEIYMLDLARFDDFATAWAFVIQNEIKDTRIYRSVYSDFVIVQGEYSSPLQAFQTVRELPVELKALKPRVRALNIIKSQLLSETKHFSARWLFDQPPTKHTVELFRGASLIQAMDFVDLNGLANSSIYKTKLAEYVVIAGVFDSDAMAQDVISKLPPAMAIFNPSHHKFSAVNSDAAVKLDQFVESEEITTIHSF